jgi:hypothetical protein
VRFCGFHHAQEQPGPLAEGAGGVTVLARFDDKDSSPAVVRRTLGRGTVMAWYTLPDTKWTDWPKDLSFLPVMNDMAWALARSRGEDLTAPVGQRIAYTIPATLADATAITLKTPAYPAEDVQLIKPHLDGSNKVAEFQSPTHAGVYQMEFALPDRSQKTVFFARTIDPAEGEMATVSETELQAALGRSFDYHGNLSIENAKVAAEQPRRSYVWIFLSLLLVVLGLEVFLAQRFGHYAEMKETVHVHAHPSAAPIGGRA